MLRLIFLFILFLFCFYSVFLKFNGIIIPIGYILLVFLCIRNFNYFLKKKANEFKYLIFLFISYIVFTYSMSSFHFLTTGTLDLRGFKGAILVIVCFISSHGSINISRKIKDDQLVFIFCLLLLINSLTIFFLFGSVSFRTFFYQLVEVDPKIFTYPIPRYAGFQYDGFSIASILNAFLILYLVLLISEVKPNKVLRLFALFSVILIFLANILVGRAGVAVSIFGLILFSAIDFFNNNFKQKFLFLKNYFATSFLLFILLIGIFYSNFLKEDHVEYINYGFSVFINLIENGKLEDSTLSEIGKNHLFLPQKEFNLFFGEGSFGRGVNYIESDLGFVLGIYGYGFFGLFLFILIIIFFIIYLLNSKLGLSLKLKLVFMWLVLIFMNFKDYYIFYPSGHYFLLFFITCFFVERNKILHMDSNDKI